MNATADTDAALPCPSCGAPYEFGDLFCEACGAALEAGPSPIAVADAPTGSPPAVPAGAEASPGVAPSSAAPDQSTPTAPGGPFGRTNPCTSCGARPQDIGADGYCTVCGLLQPGPRDHLEVDLGWAAGVTDRGLHHPHNEDAFQLERAGPDVERGIVAVVCDGVSSSVHAEEAAEAASAAAATVLAAVVAGPGSLADATVHAAEAANRAVTALPWTAAGSMASPSCTLVSAAHRGGEIAVGWVGDSRVYWLGEGQGLRQLTVDDSWAEAQVESGQMTEEEADADPRSHAITRWVGADAPALDAQVVTFAPETAGRLLLCSDGLWNYASTVGDMSDLLARQPPGGPIDLARSLTDFARDSGGHDNITVVVIQLGAPPAEDAPQTEEKGSV